MFKIPSQVKPHNCTKTLTIPLAALLRYSVWLFLPKRGNVLASVLLDFAADLLAALISLSATLCPAVSYGRKNTDLWLGLGALVLVPVAYT